MRKPDIDDGKHYSARALLSRGAVINIVEGLRRIGKSTVFKYRAICRTIRHGSRTLWLRRYEAELGEMRAKFIKPVLRRIFGDRLEMRQDGNLYVDDRLCIQIGALTQADDFRDTEDDLIDTFILDECTTRPTKGRGYLPGECGLLMDIVESVGRGRPNVRVFLLGNREIAYNPWISYFGMPSRAESYTGIDLSPDGLVAVEYCNRFCMLGGSKIDRLTRRIGYGAHMQGREDIACVPQPAKIAAYATFDCGGYIVNVYAVSNGYWVESKATAQRKVITTGARRAGCPAIRDIRKNLQPLKQAVINDRVSFGDPQAAALFGDHIAPAL